MLGSCLAIALALAIAGLVAWRFGVIWAAPLSPVFGVLAGVAIGELWYRLGL